MYSSYTRNRISLSACLPWLGWICSEIFDSVDADRSGTISAEELSQALCNRRSGEKLEGNNLQMVMKELDTDGESHPRSSIFNLPSVNVLVLG